MAGVPRARFLFLTLVWVLLALPARGDELSSWFASDPRARAYTAVQAELQEVFSEARRQEVPIGPLAGKLREGASKGVDGAKLLEALRDTLGRLVRARSILRQASGNAGASEADVQSVSLLLLRGLPEQVAVEMIGYGLQAGRGMPAVRAACDAVTSLLAVNAFGDQDALKVGRLLLAGRLPVSSYKSLPALYLKARASGLGDSEILNDLIIATLESGGGIVSMEEKMGKKQASKAGGKGPREHPPSGPPSEPPGRSRSDNK